jgi:hypothetical protein
MKMMRVVKKVGCVKNLFAFLPILLTSLLILSSFFSFLHFNLSQAAFQMYSNACLRGALTLSFHNIFSLGCVCAWVNHLTLLKSSCWSRSCRLTRLGFLLLWADFRVFSFGAPLSFSFLFLLRFVSLVGLGGCGSGR